MPKDYVQFTVPDGAKKVRITFDKEKDKLQAEFIHDKPSEDPKPDKSGDGPTATDHVKSFFTGQGEGAFANPDEEDE